MTEIDDESNVACPHCGSTDTRRTSLFGAGEMTMQYHCEECYSTFDRIKWSTDG